jgi:hypothetical protein
MTNYNKLCLNIISNICEKMNIKKGEKYATKYSNEILVHNMTNYEVCCLDNFQASHSPCPTLMIVALSSAWV